MNRKIVFRGYNLKNKQWIYGYYLVNRGKHYIVKDEVVEPFVEESDFEVACNSVGRYVGEYRGVPIYEGDYIHVTSSKDEFVNYFGYVEYDEQECRFVVRLNVDCGVDRIPITVKAQVGALGVNQSFDFCYQYKVIGNEYEKKLSDP